MKKLTASNLKRFTIDIHPEVLGAYQLCSQLITNVPPANYLRYPYLESQSVANLSVTAVLDGEQLKVIDGFQSPLFSLDKLQNMNVHAQNYEPTCKQLESIWITTFNFTLLSMNPQYYSTNFQLLQRFIPPRICQTLFLKEHLTTQMLCDLTGIDRSTLSHQRRSPQRVYELSLVLKED